MDNLKSLEAAAAELIAVFEITTQPVPIESMLQHPKAKMWEEVNIAQLSGGFLNVSERYSPRMSLARLLARHVADSEWGQERNLPALVQSQENLHAFARMLIMPLSMVMALSSAARVPATMSFHFEVPEEDARLRLVEIGA